MNTYPDVRLRRFRRTPALRRIFDRSIASSDAEFAVGTTLLHRCFRYGRNQPSVICSNTLTFEALRQLTSERPPAIGFQYIGVRRSRL
jgi:hypothetical protein